MDLEQAIKRIGEILKDAVEKVKKIELPRRGFLRKFVDGVLVAYALAKGVVLAVEQVAAEFGGLTADEKKAAAKEYLNRLIDIPVVPEFVEGWIFGYLIDIAVKYFNKLHGHKWAQDVLDGAGKTIEFIDDIFAEPEPEQG